MQKRTAKEYFNLYAITEDNNLDTDDFYKTIEDVLINGATFLQLRQKNKTHDEIVKMAKKIKPIAAKYGVPFVINDDVYAAKEADVDGVHIGQSDMDYEAARNILGPDKIIGMTAKTVEQAKKAADLGADYIGSGAVFGSTTKEDAKYLPLEVLKEITSAVNIPVVAIGGINYENMDALKDTGISGIAVVSGIFSSPNPGLETHKIYVKLSKLFNQKRSFIFDMDGTIVDSMQYWKNVANEYLEAQNVALPDDYEERVYSMNITECLKYFINELKVKDTFEEIKQKIMAIMIQHYTDDVLEKPGMKELVLREYECGSKMVIFTSSTRECVEAIMARLNLLNCFDSIFTVYDLETQKTKPESYLTVISRAGLSTDNLWVFEDAFFAIKSAKAAGLKVCAMYDFDSRKNWDEAVEIADNARFLL